MELKASLSEFEARIYVNLSEMQQKSPKDKKRLKHPDTSAHISESREVKAGGPGV